jgi:very-short-patch-repair endonuclease
MNELEKKYYDVLQEYINSQPTFQIRPFGKTVKVHLQKENDFINVFYNNKYAGMFNATYQSNIEGYIADFVVSFILPSIDIDYVIEIDGHDYHEKTKEQASRDKKRDRKMQSLFNTVFRYTGSDVYTDTYGSVKDAMECILTNYYILNLIIQEEIKISSYTFKGE